MNEGIYIFCGPTISEQEVLALMPTAICLPPICHGDIINLLIKENSNEIKVIGIIDGCFENVPSVWHKEILYAISKGVLTYGASSMGALRAAELHVFGMHGVGQIFLDFKNGLLEDDDEVAVLHGPKSVGYIPISEALVNIRQTLSKALSNGVISDSFYTALLETAKTLYYKDRTIEKIIESCSFHAPKERIEKIKTWLLENKVNQKKIDAIKMINEILNLNESEVREGGFIFQETIMWSRAIENNKARNRRDNMA